jgi:hypothetical protein
LRAKRIRPDNFIRRVIHLNPNTAPGMGHGIISPNQ